MEFVDPPPQIRGERSQKWIETVKELKANKGEWGIVGNYSPGVATHIRRGEYKAFLDGDLLPHEAEIYMGIHWEVTTRKTNNGKRNDVYIRWLG